MLFHTMKTLFSIIISVFLCFSLFSQNSQSTFHVTFGGKKIGYFTVNQTISGAKTIRNLKTVSETKIIAISVHIATEAMVIRENGKFIEGTGYRHANRGVENINCHTKLISDRTYQIIKDNKKTIKTDYDITWCIADLYFKEPKGIHVIYSNMHGQKLKIKSLGNGRYQVISNEKKDIYYTYKNGILMVVETETTVGKVTSTRV